MRSSETRNGGAARLSVLAAVLVTACSEAPVPRQTASTQTSSTCIHSGGKDGAKHAAALQTLRRSVEAGPLYTIPAAAAGKPACRASFDADAIALEYTFRDGGSLRVKWDPGIEYTEQEARFVLPSAQDAVAVLSAAELAAFGAQGCGIDWNRNESQPVERDPGSVDTVFRGDVCNCQGRIRRDAARRVVGLTLRSTC